jgi:sulfur carrier protein
VVVLVNSKPQELENGATLAALLETLGFPRQRVAVEVNARLVTRTEWEQCVLKAGDRVEVVSFVGGG